MCFCFLTFRGLLLVSFFVCLFLAEVVSFFCFILFYLKVNFRLIVVGIVYIIITIIILFFIIVTIIIPIYPLLLSFFSN